MDTTVQQVAKQLATYLREGAQWVIPLRGVYLWTRGEYEDCSESARRPWSDDRKPYIGCAVGALAIGAGIKPLPHTKDRSSTALVPLIETVAIAACGVAPQGPVAHDTRTTSMLTADLIDTAEYLFESEGYTFEQIIAWLDAGCPTGQILRGGAK